MAVSREQELAKFVTRVDNNITGDEKGQAQIFLDRLFQAFGARHGCYSQPVRPRSRSSHS